MKYLVRTVNLRDESMWRGRIFFRFFFFHPPAPSCPVVLFSPGFSSIILFRDNVISLDIYTTGGGLKAILTSGPLDKLIGMKLHIILPPVLSRGQTCALVCRRSARWPLLPRRRSRVTPYYRVVVGSVVYII